MAHRRRVRIFVQNSNLNCDGRNQCQLELGAIVPSVLGTLSVASAKPVTLLKVILTTVDVYMILREFGRRVAFFGELQHRQKETTETNKQST